MKAKVLAAFAVIYLVWGSTYLAIRFAVETMPPFTLAGARFTVAGALLLTWARLRDRSPITARQWGAAACIGGLMLLGGNGLVCWAEQWVASGLAALLIATVPLWTVVIHAGLLGGPRPGWRVVLGLVIGLVGIAVLIGPGVHGGGALHLPGSLALLAACVSWSLGSLLARRVGLPASTATSTGMQMLCAGAELLLVSAPAGEWPRVDIAAISPRSWISLAYLVLAGSILALSCFNWLMKVSTPARVSTYAYVNPVIAVLLGAALADEPLTRRTLVAAAVIVAAVVLITWRPSAGRGARSAREEK
jgi:drug/metabolite transporter (DMT)-like permease